jgi:RNA polymerase sigma-70 factor (ECF subfamily)
MSDLDPREEITQHLRPLRAFAVSLTRDPIIADDIVQDTIVKAWTNIGQFQAGTNMRAWLFTILRNTYYSNIRKLKREVEDVDGVHSAKISEKPAHDGRLQFNELRRAFEQLPLEQREALMLVGVSGFSYEEAASMCDVAVGTMKSRANRARAKLAVLMDHQPGESLDITDRATQAVVKSGSFSFG